MEKKHPGVQSILISVRCRNCGVLAQVPAGSKRLCGWRSWLSADGDGGFEVISEGDEAAAERLAVGCRRLLAECGKVIVGQKDVLEQLILALVARGHCLLVGVPGLAKTLMV